MIDKGIDYGLGQSNIDHETGIRYGVIPQNEVLQAWADSSEADYGDPSCPKCGNPAISLDPESDFIAAKESEQEQDERWEIEGYDYACRDCHYQFDSQEAYGDEPQGFNYEGNGIVATQGSDGDIFVTKSPFYTRAQFCSPCAPGAGYLMNPTDEGPKVYCFDHSWFESGKAPYPVFNISDDSEVAI